MKFYFQPVNLIRWNMFAEVNAYKHVETFYANMSMEIGDILVLYIGKQVDGIDCGVYGYATILSEPSRILYDEEDMKNNRYFVYAMIELLSYSKPLINERKCRELFKQFQSTHRIKDYSIERYLGDFFFNKNM